MFDCSFFLAVLLLLPATVAQADWIVGDPNVVDDDLLPNLSDGTVVDCTTYGLAEDFYTIELDGTSGLKLTGIHLWAAWQSDTLPSGGADDVGFSVSLHTSDNSAPGTSIWNGNFGAPTGGYLPRYFEVRSYDTGAALDWLKPSDGTVTTDAATTCYQYNLLFVDGAPTLESDEHYWLVVKASAQDASLGWVTTSGSHWNPSRWGHGGPPWSSGGGVLLVDSSGNEVPFAFAMTAVPEPTSGAMLLGLAAVVLLLRKRRAC